MTRKKLEDEKRFHICLQFPDWYKLTDGDFDKVLLTKAGGRIYVNTRSRFREEPEELGN